MTKQDEGKMMDRFFMEFKSVPTPNKLQMLSAVRGHDVRYRARRFPVWVPYAALLLVIGCSFLLAVLIAENVR